VTTDEQQQAATAIEVATIEAGVGAIGMLLLHDQ
jgi:hypothetical protein